MQYHLNIVPIAELALQKNRDQDEPAAKTSGSYPITQLPQSDIANGLATGPGIGHMELPRQPLDQGCS